MSFSYTVDTPARTMGSVLEEQAKKQGERIYLYWQDEEVSYTGLYLIF